MSIGSAQFTAFGNGEMAVVRVEGPGVCRDSGRFENLLRAVEDRHYRFVVVDLSACPRMDSTFVGALLRLANRSFPTDNSRPPVRVALAGAQGQVSELLDTLCLTDAFETVRLPDAEDLDRLAIEDRDLPREQVMALSLDTHERLASLNEANAKRFSALLPILREQFGSADKAKQGAPR